MLQSTLSPAGQEGEGMTLAAPFKPSYKGRERFKNKDIIFSEMTPAQQAQRKQIKALIASAALSLQPHFYNKSLSAFLFPEGAA